MDDIHLDAQSLFNNSNMIETDQYSKIVGRDFELKTIIRKEVKQSID